MATSARAALGGSDVRKTTKQTKVRRARRTPTELGQTTPRTARDERAKAAALKATEKGGARAARAARQYGATTAETSRRDVAKVRRRVKRKAEKQPSASAFTTQERTQRLRDVLAGRTEVKTGQEIERERTAALAPKGVQIVRALTGDEPGALTPTLGEAASIITTLASGGAGGALKAPAAAKAAGQVVKAEKAARPAKVVTKARTAKAKEAGRVKSAPKRAAIRTKARYAAPARKVRRKKRVERATVRSVNPVAPIAAQSEQGRAFAEGVATADPVKTAATTARAIPGFLAFPATVAADVGRTGVRAARAGLEEAGLPGGKEYSGKEIAGPVKGLVEETGKAFFGKGGFVPKLTSGDPEKVRDVVENELGYFAAPLIPRAATSRPAAAAQGVARTTAKKVRPGRQGPRDENVFAATERRGIRKETAKTFRRKVRPHEAEAKFHKREIVKPLRTRKMRTHIDQEMGMGPGDTIAVIAEYGISRTDPAKTIARAKKRLPAESGAPPGTITDRKVFAYLDKHPEVLREKGLWEAVDAYKRSAEPITTSERAKFMTQGEMAGAKRPEQRVPMAARELTDAPDRKTAWADLKARETKAKAEKRQGRTAAIKSQEAKNPARKEELRDVAEAHYRHGWKLADEAKQLRSVLRRYTHPDTKASARVRSTLYDRDLVNEYVDEVRAWARSEGFEEPSITSQAVARHDIGDVLPRYPAAAARTQHVRSGRALEDDIVDRSLQALLGRSVWEPRIRRGAHEAVTQFLRDEATPLVIDGKHKTVVTAPEFARAVEEGQLAAKEGLLGRGGYVLIPSRQFKQAVGNLNKKQGELRAAAEDIGRELGAREKEAGTKYVVVRREAAKEFADQVNPVASAMEKTLNQFAKGSSRALLLTNPGWAVAQIVAEALPMAAVMTNPARVAQVAAGLRKMEKTTPEEARAWASMAGESPIALSQPRDLRLEFKPGMEKEALDFHRIASRNRFYRASVSAGKLEPLGLFDRWRTGKYRKVLMTYGADKKMRQFLGGHRGLLKESHKLAEQLKGKPRHEQYAILARNEKAAKRVQDYLDDVAGSWDTFTRFEREFAPATIFYSFLRYSTRFLWTFPKHHPVRAQIAYLLGQMNAEQIEKMLGAPPADWKDYAMPVVHDQQGVSGAMPMGIRIAPGMNAISEALGSGNVAGVARAANPVLGLGVTAATGVVPFTGEQEGKPGGESLLLALNQLLAMPAPLRVAGVKVGAEEPSPISKEFDRLDPQRTVRSVLFPPLTLSGERLKARNELSKTLDESSPIQSEVGQFADLVEKHGLKEAKKILRKDLAASEKLRGFGGEDKAFEKVIDAFYETKYPPKKKPSGSSSGSPGGGGAFEEVFGGGSSGGSGGGAFERVFGS